MRAARVLTTALVMGIAGWSPATADPITDPASINQGGSYDAPLFDGSGIPFLLTTSPLYSQINLNSNSDDSGGGGDASSGGGNGGAGNPPSDPLIDSFLSASFESGPGDEGDLNDDPDGASNESNSEDNIVTVLNGGDNATGDDPPVDSPNGFTPTVDDQQRIVPEPAMFLLVGAGFAAAARRRATSGKRG